MKKASIKIKNYRENIAVIDSQINLRSKLLNSLFFLIVFCSLLYFSLLFKMVFDINDREFVELKIKEISTEVAGLESYYFSLINEVDKDNSIALGYKEVKPVFFSPSSASLGFNLDNDYSKLLVRNEI